MISRPTLKSTIGPSIACALITLSACGPGGADLSVAAVSDSAGVRIVQNSGEGLWGPDEGWSLSQVVQIGDVLGDPEYQFGNVTGLEFDAAGNIYAFDSQALEIRAFDSEGGYLRTIGSPGSGPGELGQGAAGLFMGSDGSLMVPDILNGKIARYSTDGEPLEAFPISLEDGIPLRWDIDTEGRLIVQRRRFQLPGTEAPVDEAQPDGGDPIYRFATPEAPGDTLFRLPVGGTQFDFSSGLPSFELFAAEPVWDVAQDGRVIAGVNDQIRLEVRDANGNLTTIIRMPHEQRAVTEQDKEVIFGIMRNTFEDQGVPAEALEPILGQIQFADNYPAFASVLGGPDGSVLLQGFQSAEDLANVQNPEELLQNLDATSLGSPNWDVFDSDGQYLGVLAMPEGFSPLKITDDHVLGTWKDELGVVYVRLYALSRS